MFDPFFLFVNRKEKEESEDKKGILRILKKKTYMIKSIIYSKPLLLLFIFLLFIYSKSSYQDLTVIQV